MRRLIFLLSVTLGISACGGSSKAVNRELQLSRTRTSLAEFALAQETYFLDNITYTRDLAQLGDFASPTVSVEIVELTANAYSARATNSETSDVCAVFTGAVAQLSPATVDGKIACTG